MILLRIRRVLIVVSMLSFLFVIDGLSDRNLFINLPDDFDILLVLQREQEQQQALIDARNDYLAQQYENYLADLEEQEQLRQEELDAIKNAYTLGDRDKPQDYQNLFDNSIKHTFVIDFDSTEWQGLIDDMESYHDMFGNYRSNNYRKVDVTYYTDDEELFIPDVGIRSKGNIFSRYPPVDEWGNVRPIHYVLKFNETFDTLEGTEAYDWLKTREVFDLEKLAFKWNRNGDPTYLSEVYSMQVFRDAGVAAPMMSLTKFVIRIDGFEVMSELYTVQEVIDEEFIRKQLQDVPTQEVGDLYKVIWPGTLEPIYNSNLYGIREWETNTRPVYGLETNDDVPDYQQLINFTLRLDESDLYIRQLYMEQMLDIDNMIRAFAASIFLGNPDDYRGNANNYYLYFDLQGKATYIPYDFDHSLGQGWSGEPVFIDYTLGNDIYIWEGVGFSENTRNIPLVDNVLLAYDEYRISYENYLEQFINDGIFSYASFSALFNTAESLYGDEFSMTNDKYYYFDTKINNVLEDIAFYRAQRN